MENIEQLIDSLRAGDYAAAGPQFHEIMSTKLQDALDAEQIKVASEIFGASLDDDPEPEEDDLEDEEEYDEEEDEE